MRFLSGWQSIRRCFPFGVAVLSEMRFLSGWQSFLRCVSFRDCPARAAAAWAQANCPGQAVHRCKDSKSSNNERPGVGDIFRNTKSYRTASSNASNPVSKFRAGYVRIQKITARRIDAVVASYLGKPVQTLFALRLHTQS